MNTIYVDCTSIALTDLNTGIQRVERNLIKSMADRSKRHGLAVVPVYCYDGTNFKRFQHPGLDDIRYDAGYLRAVRFRASEFGRFRKLLTTAFPFGRFKSWMSEYWRGWNKLFLTPILLILVSPVVLVAMVHGALSKPGGHWEPEEGDMLFLPGSSWWESSGIVRFLSRVKAKGGTVAVLIYDLFAATHPEYFDKAISRRFSGALPVVLDAADIVIAISAATESDVAEYLANHPSERTQHLSHLHLGVDSKVLQSGGNVREALCELFVGGNSVYLCVGTLEPRKNHGYLLDAFEILWADNDDVSLCLVGREGWLSSALLQRLRGHPEWGRKLFWFSDISDQELSYCYGNAKALIFSSHAEGFGLPLIEALQEGCPVMASDIPVFREVGGRHCEFFSLESPADLARMIRKHEGGERSLTEGFHWQDWDETADKFLDLLSGGIRN